MKIDKIIINNNGNKSYILNDKLLSLSREVSEEHEGISYYIYKATFEKFGTIYITKESFESLEMAVNMHDK